MLLRQKRFVSAFFIFAFPHFPNEIICISNFSSLVKLSLTWSILVK
jgi:hypothetical protein